jgi:hypothetical protein
MEVLDVELELELELDDVLEVLVLDLLDELAEIVDGDNVVSVVDDETTERVLVALLHISSAKNSLEPRRKPYEAEAAPLTGLAVGVKTLFFFFWAARAPPTPPPIAAPTMRIAKMNRRIKCRFHQLSCLFR